MTAHTCTTFDPTCYRCDLGRDEALAGQMDDLAEARDEAMHNCYNGANEWEDALFDLFRITHEGLSPERMSLTATGPFAQAVFALAARYLEREEAA